MDNKLLSEHFFNNEDGEYIKLPNVFSYDKIDVDSYGMLDTDEGEYAFATSIKPTKGSPSRKNGKYSLWSAVTRIEPYDITLLLSLLNLRHEIDITRKFRNGKTEATDQPLAFASVVKHYQVLSAVFAEAYRIDDIITVNPMDKVPRPAPRKDDVVMEMHTFTVEDIRYILECLEHEPLQWRVIVRLMIDTGARRGEIAGLRWSSVDFKNNMIRIENNLQYSPKLGVYETTPKGKKNRTIDIDPEIMTLLQSLHNTQKVKTLKDYCFTQPDTGLPIFPQTPTKYLKSFGKKYGIKNLHPHALRHSAATIAVTHGANIAGVAAKLGHSDTSTTLDRYTHADQNAIKMGNETYRKALHKKAE